MTALDVRPSRASFRPQDAVVVLVDAVARRAVEVVVTHVGTEVLRRPLGA